MWRHVFEEEFTALGLHDEALVPISMQDQTVNI